MRWPARTVTTAFFQAWVLPIVRPTRRLFGGTLIVFFSLQRYFVRGLLAGSVKG